MKNMIIDEIEKSQLKKDVTEFGIGDTVRVFFKITEAGKERIQAYEGVVLKRQGGGSLETATVRKIVDGVGVERNFAIHSPKVDSIKLIKKGKVRRAKLYYLRDRVGSKATKIEEGVSKAARIEEVTPKAAVA
jgi:large subunit ribosomal protein L19